MVSAREVVRQPDLERMWCIAGDIYWTKAFRTQTRSD